MTNLDFFSSTWSVTKLRSFRGCRWESPALTAVSMKAADLIVVRRGLGPCQSTERGRVMTDCPSIGPDVRLRRTDMHAV